MKGKTVTNPKLIFADRLRQCLSDNDSRPELTLHKLFKGNYQKLGIDKFSISSLLTGGIMPNEKLLHFLAHALGEDPDWLIGKKDTHTPQKPSR